MKFIVRNGVAVYRGCDMSATDRTKINALIPNLDGGRTADPELLQDAVTHLYDKMDENWTVLSGTRTASAQDLVVEVRTSDPSTPVVGRIWLRSDL